MTAGFSAADEGPAGSASEKDHDCNADESKQPVSNAHRSSIQTFRALQIPQGGERDPAPRFPSHEVQKKRDGSERGKCEGPWI